jgi:sec-independent protein translocase protein TatA
MGSMSVVHWICVLAVVLLLFGPARLAGLGKGLGEGIRGLRRGMADDPAPPPELKDGRNLRNGDA